jgi:ABC-2 type transport system ATP-binding protein
VIRQIEGVMDVQADRGAVVIQTAKAEGVLRQLLQLDLEVSEIEVSSAGLDEAFLALTREDQARA